MAGENSRENSAAAALFQRAHQKMTMLTRIDEQLSGLLDQRRKVQDELKTIQGMINEEFERITRMAIELPANVIQNANESRATGRPPRMSIAEAPQEAAAYARKTIGAAPCLTLSGSLRLRAFRRYCYSATRVITLPPPS